MGTDLRCSRFIFGTAGLFNVGTRRRRLALLHAAVHHGFTHFDTAPYYGFGQAERDLADVCRAHPAITVTSKVGIYSPGGEQQSYGSILLRKAAGRVVASVARPSRDLDLRRARESLEATLRRLERERVELYLLHEPVLDRLNLDEWRRWLEQCVTSGKIGAFGLAPATEHVESFLQAGAALTPVLQVPDSLDRRETDLLRRHGREPQITYGYVSAARARGSTSPIPDILRSALERNGSGAIIVSTGDPRRLAQYASIAERGG
jgi:aryl-alcohol dehydrogenase-like predicted oxidoreductase